MLALRSVLTFEAGPKRPLLDLHGHSILDLRLALKAMPRPAVKGRGVTICFPRGWPKWPCLSMVVALLYFELSLEAGP